MQPHRRQARKRAAPVRRPCPAGASPASCCCRSRPRRRARERFEPLRGRPTGDRRCLEEHRSRVRLHICVQDKYSERLVICQICSVAPGGLPGSSDARLLLRGGPLLPAAAAASHHVVSSCGRRLRATLAPQPPRPRRPHLHGTQGSIHLPLKCKSTDLRVQIRGRTHKFRSLSA